jgi:hypothetical protein
MQQQQPSAMQMQIYGRILRSSSSSSSRDVEQQQQQGPAAAAAGCWSCVSQSIMPQLARLLLQLPVQHLPAALRP